MTHQTRSDINTMPATTSKVVDNDSTRTATTMGESSSSSGLSICNDSSRSISHRSNNNSYRRNLLKDYSSRRSSAFGNHDSFSSIDHFAPRRYPKERPSQGDESMTLLQLEDDTDDDDDDDLDASTDTFGDDHGDYERPTFPDEVLEEEEKIQFRVPADPMKRASSARTVQPTQAPHLQSLLHKRLSAPVIPSTHSRVSAASSHSRSSMASSSSRLVHSAAMAMHMSPDPLSRSSSSSRHHHNHSHSSRLSSGSANNNTTRPSRSTSPGGKPARVQRSSTDGQYDYQPRTTKSMSPTPPTVRRNQTTGSPSKKSMDLGTYLSKSSNDDDAHDTANNSHNRNGIRGSKILSASAGLPRDSGAKKSSTKKYESHDSCRDSRSPTRVSRRHRRERKNDELDASADLGSKTGLSSSAPATTTTGRSRIPSTKDYDESKLSSSTKGAPSPRLQGSQTSTGATVTEERVPRSKRHDKARKKSESGHQRSQTATGGASSTTRDNTEERVPRSKLHHKTKSENKSKSPTTPLSSSSERVVAAPEAAPPLRRAATTSAVLEKNGIVSKTTNSSTMGGSSSSINSNIHNEGGRETSRSKSPKPSTSATKSMDRSLPELTDFPETTTNELPTRVSARDAVAMHDNENRMSTNMKDELLATIKNNSRPRIRRTKTRDDGPSRSPTRSRSFKNPRGVRRTNTMDSLSKMRTRSPARRGRRTLDGDDDDEDNDLDESARNIHGFGASHPSMMHSSRIKKHPLGGGPGSGPKLSGHDGYMHHLMRTESVRTVDTSASDMNSSMSSMRSSSTTSSATSKQQMKSLMGLGSLLKNNK